MRLFSRAIMALASLCFASSMAFAGIAVQASDPQVVFPPGSSCQGTWVGVTFQWIGPFGFQEVLSGSTKVGWQDQEWIEFGIPFGALQTNSVPPADPAARAALMLSMQDSPGEILANVAAAYPDCPQPLASWIAPYVGPEPTSLGTLFSDFVGIWVLNLPESKNAYKAYVIARNAVLSMMDDYTFASSVIATWGATSAYAALLPNRPAVMAQLAADDVNAEAALPN